VIKEEAMTTDTGKKSYERPNLVIYGSIKEITKAPFNNGMGDGGGTGQSMTSLT
jgi:hypothetical protein